MIPELAWLSEVRRRAAAQPRPPAALRLGIGDDAALVRPRPGWELALTTDLMVEGVHFLRRREPAATVGERLATRALSDLAAMGADPVALLLSSAYPARLPPAWPRQMVRGLLHAARAAGAVLAGGDLSAMPRAQNTIVLDVVGVGQVPPGAALRRDGARPGDLLYASGPLGEAALGRALVQAGRRPRTAAERRARQRHLHPQARWKLGAALRGRATAAIDVSDGLAPDLAHLCRASRVGAEFELPPGWNESLALGGGEDYELLFTVPPRRPLPPHPGLVALGHITAAPGLWLLRAGRRHRLPRLGWEHFT
ncbi:MAG: thiamine-phosphate kinase [Terriglobales bacterium]